MVYISLDTEMMMHTTAPARHRHTIRLLLLMLNTVMIWTAVILLMHDKLHSFDH